MGVFELEIERREEVRWVVIALGGGKRSVAHDERMRLGLNRMQLTMSSVEESKNRSNLVISIVQ